MERSHNSCFKIRASRKDCFSTRAAPSEAAPPRLSPGLGSFGPSWKHAHTAIAWATRPTIMPAITVRQADQQAISQTIQRKAVGRAVSMVDPLPSRLARHLQPHSVSHLPMESGNFLGSPHISSSIVFSRLPPCRQGKVIRERSSKPLSHLQPNKAACPRKGKRLKGSATGIMLKWIFKK